MIVYGMGCAWWDSIEQTARTTEGGSLPCCPFCHSVLFQMDDKEWEIAYSAHKNDRVADYSHFMRWLRGKCFKTIDYAIDQYLRRGEQMNIDITEETTREEFDQYLSSLAVQYRKTHGVRLQKIEFLWEYSALPMNDPGLDQVITEISTSYITP